MIKYSWLLFSFQKDFRIEPVLVQDSDHKLLLVIKVKLSRSDKTAEYFLCLIKSALYASLIKKNTKNATQSNLQ